MTQLLVAAILLAFPYIGLGAAVPIGSWHLDAPIADLAAALLLPLAMLGMNRRNLVPLPGPVGYGILLLAAALAIPTALDPRGSLHFLVRKPLFFYLAYGIGLAFVVARELPPARLRALLLASVTVASLVSIGTSVFRIAAGNALWFQQIDGLTNNHKTLSVALAPLIPLLLGLRKSRLDLAVVGLAIAALLLSVSRTSWITAAVGLSYVVVWKGRTLASRRGVVLGTLVVGIVLALYAPLLTHSATQLDAARSRHSLDKRAWILFSAHPVVGAGGGSSVLYEQQTFPDYRVNGVDAHGVVQKVGSEFGLVGLLGWIGFVVAMGAKLRPKEREDGIGFGLRADAAEGAFACFVALNANLLLSTETFSQTHWAPLAIVWGLAHRRGVET